MMTKVLARAALTLALGLFSGFSGAAFAQSPECDQLRAALAAPARGDPAAAAAAQRLRGEIARLSASAHGQGCDNQQFLFFGSAPPPQCSAIKARLSGLQSQYEAAASAAGGDDAQRRSLRARYNQLCGAKPKNFFETLFGGGGRDEEDGSPNDSVPPDGALTTDSGESPKGGGAIGGSQAICVRSCDGGFFPLNFSARSASNEDLQALCSALCPNTEVKLFSRNPRSDIATALGADGQPYRDLPNALKFQKSFDPACTCKPPNQSWVEALAHAEQLLNDMGGAKASDNIVTEEQSRAMSQPTPLKPAANKDQAKEPELKGAIAPNGQKAATKGRIIEGAGPDGETRQIRVVGPKM